MKEMNDLIRRKDAMEAMRILEAEDNERYGCSIPECFDSERAIEALEKLPSAEPERNIIRCEDCIYYDPAHVEKDGLRYEYKDMPEEAYGPFGTPGCVTVKYGINVGGRCTYEQDMLVFRQRNDFCSRAEMRGE